jgi:HD-like signal output (HDOD) protein
MNMIHHAGRAQQGRATLELLWERIRRRGDMPGFTKAITAILGAMRGEDDGEFSMTRTVLTDPVLTQKVLRLANSGMYAAFGQRVNTISKAVMVLGLDAIGHLALGLKLVEELTSSSTDSMGAQVEMEKAVLAGMVAQQVAATLPNVDAEEAVVCSILQTLGRMMVTFYLPEQWEVLQAGGAGREEDAAPAVLGLTLEEIGRATAEHWGLPKNLVAGMRTIAPASLDVPEGLDRWATPTGWRRCRPCRPSAPKRCGTMTRPAPCACVHWSTVSRRCWVSTPAACWMRSTAPKRWPPSN